MPTNDDSGFDFGDITEKEIDAALASALVNPPDMAENEELRTALKLNHPDLSEKEIEAKLGELKRDLRRVRG